MGLEFTSYFALLEKGLYKVGKNFLVQTDPDDNVDCNFFFKFCLFVVVVSFFFWAFCFVFLQAAFGNYYSEDLAETLQMYHRSGRSFDELDNTIADFCDASYFQVRKIRLRTKLIIKKFPR